MLAPHYQTSTSPKAEYPNDTYGWNFAERNNQVIDYKYLGTFSPDMKRFFEIQKRILEGTATEEERKWMNEKRQDQAFMKELGKFGNFTHGTHVGGITILNDAARTNKIFGVKLIPTEAGLGLPRARQLLAPYAEGLFQSFSAGAGILSIRLAILKILLGQVAKQQTTMLEQIGKYVGMWNADVANGSFGTGYEQAKLIVGQLGKTIVGRELTEAETEEVAKSFLETMVTEAKKFVDASPRTLFVFAAGNDGRDNDIFPTSPTNIVADNKISVAATLANHSLARFSNFGMKMVDVAAPGVGILSTLPGGKDTGYMSGTSQAAPYVAGVAGQLKEQNKALTPKDLKKILIGTVDMKDWLSGKVVSGGVINTVRAVHAAKLSSRMSVESAITQSRQEIADIETIATSREIMAASLERDEDLFVLPLPSPIQ
jgi:subtilisin family serine protease